MELWIVGQIRTENSDGIAWELQGVFDNKEDAIRHCKNENYFIGPAKLNECLPDETTKWPGCYYPLAKNPDRNKK